MADPSNWRQLPWRRIFWVQTWLCAFPPLGIWLLWKDPEIPGHAKGRILVYTYLIPFLVYLALTLFIFGRAEKAIEAFGGNL